MRRAAYFLLLCVPVWLCVWMLVMGYVGVGVEWLAPLLIYPICAFLYTLWSIADDLSRRKK